jgi:type IV pilus assembly protein PilV
MDMKNSSRDKSRSNIAGFTLIELVVAILVFALGIMGIMKMHSATIQSNNYSMQLTEAVNIAQGELEFLRGLGFSHNSMSVGVHNATETARGIPYNLTWQVTDPGLSTPSRNVAINVQWQEKSLNHALNMEVRWDELH